MGKKLPMMSIAHSTNERQPNDLVILLRLFNVHTDTERNFQQELLFFGTMKTAINNTTPPCFMEALVDAKLFERQV